LADSSSPTEVLSVAHVPSCAATAPKSNSRRRATIFVLGATALVAIALAAWALRPWSPGSDTERGDEYPVVAGAGYLNGLEVIDADNWPFRLRIPPAVLVTESASWPAPLGGHRVVINGKVSPHGVWTHLPPMNTGSTSVTFNLAKRYRTFRTAVSLNDGPRHCVPLTFTVYGDRCVLWKSIPVSSQADTQFSSVLS